MAHFEIEKEREDIKTNYPKNCCNRQSYIHTKLFIFDLRRAVDCFSGQQLLLIIFLWLLRFKDGIVY